MDILKFTIDKVEGVQFASPRSIEVRGTLTIIDSNGVEQALMYQGWDDRFQTEITGPNGEDLGYNDLWVETEDEQGYVLTSWDGKAVSPVEGATLRLNDADYATMYAALDVFIRTRLNRAYDAADEAFMRVMNDAR